MIIDILFVVIGLVLLIKGADWFVEGASALAREYNVSDLAIGLTIVAFGTSAPELVVNAVASFNGQSEIVLGNVIGSSNFNLFIILGVGGLIAPLMVHSKTVYREIPLSIFAIGVVYLLCNPVFTSSAILTRFDAFILFLVFIIFLYLVFRQLKTDTVKPEIDIRNLSKGRMTIYIFLGLAILIFGGKLAVDHAVEIAMQLGWSEKIIGVTILAVGTSLPELVTTVVAVRKGNNNIAVGNVIGSNLFNLLFILAVSALIQPVEYSAKFNVDLLILAAGTILLFLILFISRSGRLGRPPAFLFLITYLVYTIYLIL